MLSKRKQLLHFGWFPTKTLKPCGPDGLALEMCWLHFSHHKCMVSGQIWPVFEVHLHFNPVLVTYKYNKDLIKNEAVIRTTIPHYKYMSNFFMPPPFYYLPHSGGVLWFHVGRLWVRWSVRFSFPDDNLSKHQWIFTKLGMCIDIVEIWFGIANGQISSIFDGVICWRHAHIFISRL